MRGKKELVGLILGLALFLLDVGTDCYVAHQFRLQGESGWYGMTLTFIIIPLFVVNLMAFIQSNEPGTWDSAIMRFCISGCFCLMQLSMVCRYRDQLQLWKLKFIDCSPCCENYKKCENCEDCREYRDVESEYNSSAYTLAWISYIETLLESIPQWCLQAYVMLSQWSFPWYTVLSTVISLVSLAWSTTALEKARADMNGENFNLKSTILYFTSQLAVLMARLISIVSCAYSMKAQIFLILIFLWLTGSIVLSFIFCGYMVVSCCRGDTKCCDGSAKETCQAFLLTFPLTFYVSETVLESFGFTALWIKMSLFIAKSLENLLMLAMANLPSVPNLDTWMPIAWSLFAIGTVSGFVSLIARHSERRRDVPARPDANGDEPGAWHVNVSGGATATNSAFVV